MSVVLKAKKLARMSPDELRYRAREYFDIRAERKNFEAELSQVSAPDFRFWQPEHASVFTALQEGDLQPLLDSDAIRAWPIPLDDGKAQEFKKRFPDLLAASLKRAEQFAAHKFAYMGIEFSFNGQVHWQRDPLSKKDYPGGFYRDIEIFRNHEGSDIKHVWELNRLQFLIELAKAAYLTGEERFQTEFETLTLDWIAKNPYKSGVAWTSALEVGVRTFSLIWGLNFYLATGRAKADVVFAILKLLYTSGRHIEDNLSVYFSPYNHLIGEVAALFMIGYQFPCLRHAQAWESQAWQIMDDQVEKQFHPDGGTVEQATFYHHFTLGFYLQCAYAMRLNGDSAGSRVLNRCEQALDFARQLTRPDGTLPWVGDIDAARSLYFSDPAHWDFRGFQAIGAAWFGRPDMKQASGGLREEALWLLSVDDLKRYEKLADASPRERFYTLPSSGYTVMRNGWQNDSHFSFIDCGPIAHGIYADGTPSAAHGHADLLAVEIAPHGESLLIDPGFSNYRGERDWHNYFRSTSAHNTIAVDGESQLLQVGILNWSHAPRFERLQRFDGKFAVGFAGEHYGYHRLAEQPTHRRYFLFIGEAFWLTWDVLLSHALPAGEREHDIVANFHAPEHTVMQELTWKNLSGFCITGHRAKLNCCFQLSADSPPQVAIQHGGAGPEQGWISPTYRERRAAPKAQIRLREKLPVSLIGLYLPEQLGQQHALKVSARDSVIRIEIDAQKFEIQSPAADAGVGSQLVISRHAGDIEHKIALSAEAKLAGEGCAHAPIQDLS